jgi:hypothetical protein
MDTENIEIIQNIINDGLEYINEQYAMLISMGTSSDKNDDFTKLLQLYFDITDDGIIDFCDEVIENNDTVLLNYGMTEKNINIILNEFAKKTVVPPKILLNVLSFCKNITVEITNDNIFRLVKKLLESLKSSDDGNEIVTVCELITKSKYMKNNKTRNRFVEFFTKELKYIKNFSPNVKKFNYYANLFSMSCLLFNKGINQDNKKKIDVSYLTEKYDKTKEYNFITQTCKMSMYAMNFIGIQFLLHKHDIVKDIKNLEDKTNSLIALSSTNSFVQSSLMNIYKTIKKWKIILNGIKGHIKKSYYISTMNLTYANIADVIILNKIPQWDELLTNLYTYLTYTINDPIYDINNYQQISTLMCRIIGTKLYTTNPHIRSKYMTIIGKLKIDNIEYEANIIESVMNLYIDIYLSKTGGLELEKIYVSLSVYEFITSKLFKDDIATDKLLDIVQIVDKNENKVKMFINFIVKEMGMSIESLFKVLEKYIKMNDDYEQQLMTNSVIKLVEYCSCAWKILYLFVKNNSSLRDIISSKELLLGLRMNINSYISEFSNFFTKENKDGLKVIEDRMYIKININTVTENMIKLITIFKDDIDTLEYIFISGDGLNTNKLSNMINDPDLNTIIESMEKYDNSDSDCDYPEKFLDQITLAPLSDPVIIPDTFQFVNRDTILQCILTDQLNPFNREKLTVDRLTKFNLLDESKKKISELMNEFKEWKITNK